MLSGALKKREDIERKYKWSIEDIYVSDEFWESDYEKAKKLIPQMEKYKGRLGLSATLFFGSLNEREELSLLISRLYVYANMKFHENGTVSAYQDMSSRAESLYIEFSSATAYAAPEILGIPEEKLREFLAEKKEYGVYSHFIENILRGKPHTLSAPEEELLAKTGEMAGSFQNIFTMLNDADIKFPEIKDDEGNLVELTKGRYLTFLESGNPEVRKNAFIALYDVYLKQKNTLASIYHSSVKKDVFYSGVRKYASSLEAALDEDNIPVSVYTSLISAVHEKISLLHRYVALRKKILGLKTLNIYDLYTPLVPEINKKIPYEDAKVRVIEGLWPLGDEYAENLKAGLQGGWVDVYENVGKRGGAYSWGVYSVHPFVLLNHNDNINSMFTIAHEMGHALHSFYTWKTMPYIYSGHKIFVAEVASTVNEALLMDHLLKSAKTKKERMYLINYFMEQFRGTLFRQTMFAEFEKTTHEMVERGETLTCENLMKIYRDLNRFYYGPEIRIDSRIDVEWGRIPHFYEAFYVYQYATGYSAAIALSGKILKEGMPAVEKYKDFLKKGDSEYSIDLLKGAGVDMTSPEPVKEALGVFEGLLDEMEALSNEL